MVTTTNRPAGTPASMHAYALLEEKILTRDQVGASGVFYDLVKARRPLPELLRETVRIHAPYTHVPYHQRLDSGVVKFVNNDHCLLSAGAGLRLMKLLPKPIAYLPFAQTIWYIPTGLDPWNQLLGFAPGHYTRLYKIDVHAAPPPPQIHWQDQEPLPHDGDFQDGLDRWLTLVQVGDVVTSYRVFLGLLADEANRPRLLAQLAFAGLIDVQDRMLYNRSYTTGHKAYRARATVEIGNAVGWDSAHPVVYAGVPDIAVGPRWYSTYEMACNISQLFLDGNDFALRHNVKPLTRAEQQTTVDLILHSREPAWIHHLTALLKAGKGIRNILDCIQVAAAGVILQTSDPNGFSMPQHGYEYTNTLRWFYDTFEHPHMVKLLYVAASFINQASHHLAAQPSYMPLTFRARRGASGLDQARLLQRIDDAVIGLRADESVALASLYLRSGFDREPLVEVLATAAAKIGNDPHNQEIGLCLIEDYLHSTAHDRDRLLLASAKHTAGHRKYGDPLEAYRRFAEAFGVETRQDTRGDGDPREALLDD